MKKVIVILLGVMVFASLSYAADFSPTMMKLSADPIIQYNFDGSELEIPFTVSGTTAAVIFLVYTKDQAEKISEITNGFLGWHYVNKIDTCIYYSTVKGFDVGSKTITWDGKDQDGGVVPAGEYTYYMWAFDNVGAKDLVSKYVDGRICHDYRNEIQELDENGLPIANPIIYGGSPTYGWPGPPYRWSIGSDPLDPSRHETATLPLAEGWGVHGDFCLEPTDFRYFYINVRNGTSLTSSVQKYRWVPGGECELLTDFGDAGWAESFSTLGGGTQGPGVTSDDDYLFCCDEGHTAATDPVSAFYIYDFDGMLIDEVSLTDWWSDPDDLAAGGQMTGGPLNFTERHDLLVLNAHSTCINNMVDPKGYLESGDEADFFLWANANGDYVLDHNFEETAALPWVCNDYNVGPYKTSVALDDNLFTVINAYDIGVVSFGLLGPDGTGLGYYLYAGDTAGLKGGSMIIDSETAFDGIYTDNQQTGGDRFDFDSAKADSGMFFLGHDSISGVITTVVGVEEEAPASFSVAQNSPNPFNPTTTISYSLTGAGNVSVEVYNVAGQKVDTLVDGFMDAGSHSVVWDASDLSAGVYFYTVKSGELSRTMKMTLLK